MKRIIFSNRLMILFLIIVAGLAAVCLGQEGDQKDDAEPIRFRRLLAPLERIDDWPYGQGRYLPIDRNIFEQWAELLEKTSEQSQQEKASRLTRIVLEAELDGRQLTHGKGFFEFRNGDSKKNAIPLEPWGLWIDSLTFEDGTPVSLVRTPKEKIHLILPPDKEWMEKESILKQIHFQWSLRSRNETQGDLLFDFTLPPSAAVELQIDLPVSMVPVISNGIVMEPQTVPVRSVSVAMGKPQDSEPPKNRRWRILLSRNARTVLTITTENKDITRQKTAIQQTIRYSIMPQGTDVTAKIFFDKSDARLNELQVELESPLRAVDVRYGEHSVSWSQSPSEDRSENVAKNKNAGTLIHIDLSEAAKDEPVGELTIDAVCSVQADGLWTLPRIQVVSPNVFWKETRCGVHVQNPLLIRNIFCKRAVQVTPRNPVDRNDWEQFVFQFFGNDSQIAVDVAPHVPRVNLNSAVQIQWGSNEIRGNMIVDCIAADGECYTLEFPISPHWTIDSVRSVYWTVESTKVSGGNEILTWDVIRAKNEKNPQQNLDTSNDDQSDYDKLSIQLKHPLQLRKLLRLQLTGHFQMDSQNTVSRNEFRLGEVFPLAIPTRRDETHYIAVAVQSAIPYHLQFRSQNHSAFEMRDADSRLSQRFSDTPSGIVFPVNTQTRELQFTIERLKPNYTSEITGNILLREKEFVPNFRFRCQPVHSSVDRVYVHLMGLLPETTLNDGGWAWSGTSESVHPLQAKLLSQKERQELFPSEANDSGAQLSDEIWEIRLAAAQTAPFEILATTTIPLHSTTNQPLETIPVPLAAMPAAAVQKGEIYIESPKLFQYYVLNSRLQSIPVAPTEWYRYQEIRAAFRYDPNEESRLVQTPLFLKHSAHGEETLPSAWIWSLRLDTQYETEGIVKDNAVFLLENRGKDSLRIQLPEGIDVGDVHAVWRNAQRITWHPEPSPNQQRQNIVVVALPEGTRFVSVSLEYSHQNIPLTGLRELEPRYPSADVPILSGNWTLWLPPEFDVHLRRPAVSETVQSFPLSEAMNHLLLNSRFDPLSLTEWKELLYKKQRYREAETASQIFFHWITTGLNGNTGQNIEQWDPSANPSRETGGVAENVTGNVNGNIIGNFPKSFLNENTSFRNGLFQSEGDPPWAAVFGNEKKLIEMLGETRQNGIKGVDAKIMIDKQSFALLGMTPLTPVILPEAGSALEYGTELFKRHGLVLFVSSKVRPDSVKEYTFYVTSFLTSSLHRQFLSEPISHCSRYVPETTGMIYSPPENSVTLERALTGFGNPQWTPLGSWIKESPPFSPPWSISSQIVRLASITPDWSAFEMPKTTNQSLYIIHRGTFSAYHWLAFLTIVVLTARKQFSSPIFLIALLISFEILTRLITPCYVGIPSGAFLGAAVSLGFSLIRSRTVTKTLTRFHRRPVDSTNASITELTDSEKFEIEK